MLYATFLWWYVVYEPVMSHSASFFMAALVLRAARASGSASW
jgi:hypothetical protein